MSPIGQVFTPPALAAEILDAVPARPGRVLDPACGTGNFLVDAARRWPSAELVGFENDPAAAAIARERLPYATIAVKDALAGPISPDFDLVCGNPPYAAAFRATAERERARAAHVTASGGFDLAVPFVERSVGWLRPGGWLALVVTNKILVKDYATRLRVWLLQELAVHELWDLAVADAFPGSAIDVCVLVGQRGGTPSSTKIVLAKRDGTREVYLGAPTGSRGRWEVYLTPAISHVLNERILADADSLGDLSGVTVRDGVLGRDYHKVELGTEGVRVVGVGRLEPGRIAWERPLRRGRAIHPDPRSPVSGAFGTFCETPKVLVKGVSRRVVAAFAPDPVVPLTAVRAIVGHSDPVRLVEWLNDPLTSFYLQATCRSDRIPNGSFNISKSWLQGVPIPRSAPCLDPDDVRAMADWLAAFGI